MRPAPPTYFLKRGDYASKGPEVSPMFPLVLVAAEAEAIPKIDSDSNDSGRRKALASWLTRRTIH